MILSKIVRSFLTKNNINCNPKVFANRLSTQFSDGTLKPKPESSPFAIVGVFCAVIPGLFIGAAISQNIANFLEENDLFVPSDDDDNDDD